MQIPEAFLTAPRIANLSELAVNPTCAVWLSTAVSKEKSPREFGCKSPWLCWLDTADCPETSPLWTGCGLNFPWSRTLTSPPPWKARWLRRNNTKCQNWLALWTGMNRDSNNSHLACLPRLADLLHRDAECCSRKWRRCSCCSVSFPCLDPPPYPRLQLLAGTSF